jgi:hypothetical protein
MIEKFLAGLTTALQEHTKVQSELLNLLLSEKVSEKAPVQKKAKLTEVKTKPATVKEEPAPTEEKVEEKSQDELELSDLVSLIKQVPTDQLVEVRKIFGNYGAKKLPDVKQSDFKAVHDDVCKLIESDKAA